MLKQANALAKKTMFWCNMLKIIPALNQSNGGHSRPVSSWCNPYTAPPQKIILIRLCNWWIKNNFSLPKYWISLKCNLV